ncbi:hypothetical protein [Robbsia andropogonis]|uniref:hypothetical protein n=1 Tax=Robbsia andropogonis TaxID=28092 RepID=UPI0020A04482|nr:hypothetical protein [Robbsia andropogonis]MCP1121591.1 hypothetical protein [Robbsia andropogonis]MCP1131402.1 hypothetical protein [Robbsia andropogonis]
MHKRASVAVLQAVAVTAELCGSVFSEGAAAVFASDLADYPEAQVLDALTRCRREVTGRLTIAHVVSRIDDGRPGPEEAWAIALKGQDEAATVVMTEEIAQAMGVARTILEEGDEVGARMAFREVYQRLLVEARDRREAPEWFPSLGTDVNQRASALHEAAERGLLSQESAVALLPPPEVDEATLTPAGRRGIAAVKAALANISARQAETARIYEEAREAKRLAELQKKKVIALRVATYNGVEVT